MSLCKYILPPRRGLGKASARPRRPRSAWDDGYGMSERAYCLTLFNQFHSNHREDVDGLDKGGCKGGWFLATKSPKGIVFWRRGWGPPLYRAILQVLRSVTWPGKRFAFVFEEGHIELTECDCQNIGRSIGSGRTGSTLLFGVAHGPSRAAECGILDSQVPSSR